MVAADGALSNTGNQYRVDTNTRPATAVGALVDPPGNAYSINTTTGAITGIGQFRDANTLEFLRNIDALAVPGPATAGVLGAIGLAGLRRRR